MAYIANELNIRLDEVIAIGDSIMDIDIIDIAGLGVAVSNADEELKKHARYVTGRPSSKGFIELAEMLLESRL